MKTDQDRKFYKTTFTIVVLSEEPVPNMEMDELFEEMTTGSYSGQVYRSSETILDGRQAANELIEQGSSPEFFELTEQGESI